MRELADNAATVADRYADDLVLVVAEGEFIAPAPDGYTGTASTLVYEPGDVVPKAQVSAAEFRANAEKGTLVLMNPDAAPEHGQPLSQVSSKTVESHLRAAARGNPQGFAPEGSA
jgi:hypothetical protein